MKKAIRLPRGKGAGIPWRVAVAVCFILFFLAGILAANWVGKEQLMRYSMLNEYYVGQLAYTQLDTGDYFLYLLKKRGRVFALTVLLGYTRFGVPALAVAAAWYAFSLGYLFVDALVCMGLGGMALALVSLFPQIVFYVLFCVLLAHGMLTSRAVAGESKERASFLHTQAGASVAAAAAALAGIWLESHVNPVLLQWFIRRF